MLVMFHNSHISIILVTSVMPNQLLKSSELLDPFIHSVIHHSPSPAPSPCCRHRIMWLTHYFITTFPCVHVWWCICL